MYSHSFLFIMTVLMQFTFGSKVIRLGRQNFTTFRWSHERFMLLFSVNWCTHCIRLWPEYELAATELSKLEIPVPLTVVDGTIDTDLVKDFSIYRYPTIMMISGELIHKYDGRSRASDLIEFAKREVSQFYEPVESVEELNLKIKPDDAVLLGLFSSMEHSRLNRFRKSLSVASKTLRPFLSISETVRRAFNAGDTDFTALILKPRQFTIELPSAIVNVTKYYYNNSVSEVDIAKQLAKEQLPVIGVYNEASENLYGVDHDHLLCAVPFAFSLATNPAKALDQQVSRIFKEIIREYGDRVYWVIVDDLENPVFLSRFSKPDAYEEVITACKWGNRTYQLYGDQLETEELKAFTAKTLMKVELESHTDVSVK